MRQNDPFRPALAKPLSDRDLANDPHPDNFLAGNDGLGRRLNRRITMDNMLQPEAPIPPTPVVEQPAPAVPEAPDLTDLSGLPEPPATDFSDLKAAANQDPLDKPLDVKESDKDATQPEVDAAPVDAAPSDQPPVPTAKDQPPVARTKAPKQRQVTISLLTIIFFILFLASTGVAVWFGYDNNKKNAALADAQAKLAQSSDYISDRANSSSKTSTQFDALQAKIADLTKKNDEAKQQLDEKQKSIDDQNKKIADLTKQNGDFQTKINSDKSIADNLRSLSITLCATNPAISGSAPCVQLSANGNQNGDHH